jgi:hypothetical protein
MKYSVNWARSAKLELMIDPHHEGMPRKKGYRSLFVTPLTVEYAIDDNNRTVTIRRVRVGNIPF